MIVVPPIPVTDATLTTTNVTETDYTDWVISTGYIVGDERQITTPDVHTVYECTAAHTSDATNKPDVDVDPVTGIGAFWIRLGATNPWSMFTDQISDQTENATSIAVTITPGQVFDSVTFFNVEGSDVVVEVDDPTDGIVYSKTIELIDESGVFDWFSYYFNPVVQKTDFTLIDLPPYGTAELNITINSDTTAKCGLVVVGYQASIGTANYGTTVGIRSFSSVDQDTFGRPIIIPRNFSKRSNYDVIMSTGRVDFVQRLLSTLRDSPSVWIGSSADGFGASIVYGFYKDFDILYNNNNVSTTTLQVEGLT